MSNTVKPKSKEIKPVERRAIVNKPVVKFRKKTSNEEVAEIIKAWTVKTKIIDIIKKADPEKPFYYDITPDVAMDLLTLNDPGRNRIIDWSVQLSYEEQMASGKWMSRNGTTIAISKEGMLLDGQTRLWAIYRSGVTISYLIVTGLNKEAFPYMDIGRNRSAADMASIHGYQANQAALSQAIKLILLFKSKSIVKGCITIKDVKNHEVNAFLENRAVMNRLIKELTVIKDTWVKKTPNFFTPPQWLFISYLLRNLPGMEEEAQKFLNQFAFGTNLRPNSPITIVRGYFINQFKHLSKGHGKMSKSNLATLTTKVKYLIEAWNLHVRKTRLSEIKVDLSAPQITKPIYSVPL